MIDHVAGNSVGLLDRDRIASARRTIRTGTDPVGPTGKAVSSILALGLPTGIDCARTRTDRASSGDKLYIGDVPASPSTNCWVCGSSVGRIVSIVMNVLLRPRAPLEGFCCSPGQDVGFAVKGCD